MDTKQNSLSPTRRQVLLGASAVAALTAVPVSAMAGDPDAELRRLYAEWIRLRDAADAADDRVDEMRAEVDRAVPIPRAISYRQNWGRAREYNGLPDRAITSSEIDALFIDQPGKRRYRERLWIEHCRQKAEAARRLGIAEANDVADDLGLRMHDAFKAFAEEPARTWAGLAFKLSMTARAMFPGNVLDPGADYIHMGLYYAAQDAERLGGAS